MFTGWPRVVFMLIVLQKKKKKDHLWTVKPGCSFNWKRLFWSILFRNLFYLGGLLLRANPVRFMQRFLHSLLGYFNFSFAIRRSGILWINNCKDSAQSNGKLLIFAPEISEVDKWMKDNESNHSPWSKPTSLLRLPSLSQPSASHLPGHSSHESRNKGIPGDPPSWGDGEPAFALLLPSLLQSPAVALLPICPYRLNL